MTAQTPFIGAIMTHPLRTSLIRYHRRWWPGWTRVVDDGCGLVENFCRTLLAADCAAQSLDLSRPTQRWVMVVNDDMRPAPDLAKALPFILSHAPTPIVSFFSFRYKADARSLEKGERWRMRKSGDLIYTSAMAVDLHAVSIPDVVDHIRAGEGKHDDGRFTDFVDTHSPPLAVSTHIPCLVQHTHPDKSLVGNPPTIMGRNRVTVTFPEGLTMKQVLERYPYE